MMTYRKFILATMCLLTAFAFSSCNKDEDPAGDVFSKLKENQISIDGKILQVNATLAIRPVGRGWEGDPGAYYVDIMPVDETAGWHGRYDLGTPIIGKTIDLANPAKAIGESQFSMYFEDANNFENWNVMFALEGGQGILDNKELSGSCFSSGTFNTSHDTKDGFNISFSGELTNGKVVALKAYVPEKEVEYW